MLVNSPYNLHVTRLRLTLKRDILNHDGAPSLLSPRTIQNPFATRNKEAFDLIHPAATSGLTETDHSQVRWTCGRIVDVSVHILLKTNETGLRPTYLRDPARSRGSSQNVN